ncbi:DUF58 domain-containing protein [Methylomarinum sp. Ch1-1]|uniref:DUF58 domain-containing protein n=1 Tax=Methylomarinum roseum TaxID=3067653 RepID=A0AAU7NYT1_9GAMM|nr:DUF58 domain-containing protein [Methylomarinum sp. Ch1-1]MDP4521722.1 DUF58 domain-containing protein [Methylomarinum sp. Ch1-1]
MTSKEPQRFDYRVSAKIRGAYPGAHVGQMVGAGQLFKRHAPLIASPDPRRIDLRVSALDPFEQFNVRVFQQTSQLTVYLVADLSASMGFQGVNDKQQALVDCLLSIAASVWRSGDRFGFVGCSDSVEQRYLVTPSANSQGRVRQLADNLLTSSLQGGAEGLMQARRYLPSQPALVFLLSDFYLSMTSIERLLQSLNHHFVVPLVLWDKQEYQQLPDWGSMRLRDLESGKQRTLLLRPALKRKIIDAFRQRHRQLQRIFRAFGCEPLFLQDGYRAEQLSQYFLRQSA